jgi:hypothetical protein
MAYSDATNQLLFLFGNDTDKLIVGWQQAAKELDAAKLSETMLRRAVFEIKFPAAEEGTNRVELGNGYALKAVNKYNYRLKNKDGETEKALEAIARHGNDGPFIADRLVKWEPEISISEYRKLEEKYKLIIGPVLTITPGMPTLEIEEPKANG